MKKEKDMTLEMNSPGCYVPNMLLEKTGEITPERMERWSQIKKKKKKKKKAHLWM